MRTETLIEKLNELYLMRIASLWQSIESERSQCRIFTTDTSVDALLSEFEHNKFQRENEQADNGAEEQQEEDTFQMIQ